MARTNPKRKQECAGTSLEGELKNLEKMNYATFGKHSAVQICHWTKNALRGEGHCWKEEIYGISSAGCVQMTPAVLWCEHNCVHCWRPLEKYKGSDILKDTGFFNEPKEIIDGLLKKRRDLLMGFKGSKNLDKEAFEKALNPSLFTMSLSGEATLYPRIGELFKEIRKRGAVSFLVTNGLNPNVIRAFPDDQFPTQLVISTNAPNEKLYNIWHRSRDPKAWEKFNESLDLMKKLKGKTRRVIRMTLVKDGEEGIMKNLTNMSDDNLDEYAALIKKAEPDFIHVKGYKSVGYARKRIGYSRQPWHDEIKIYSKMLENRLPGYKIRADYPRSCIVMLARDGVELKITKP